MSTTPSIKTEIIVVLYQSPYYEKMCIESVMRYTEGYKLTIYDNYPQNENLGKLWNRLIRASNCPYICLLNSDTIVSPKWLVKMLKVLPKAKIVGPMTNRGSDEQTGKHSSGVKYVRELAGFCYLFPRSLWLKLGGFDETYPFYGQESDFNRKTLLAGYKLAVAQDAYVYHVGGGSVELAEQRGEMNQLEERKKGIEAYIG